LGQDIFELSGIKASYDEHDPPEHFVQLNIQYRMHPHIKIKDLAKSK
jgi:superfamily I DNA and/or RNA helicase